MSQREHLILAYALWMVTFHGFLKKYYYLPKEREYWKKVVDKYFKKYF